jgi:hypothetical protein
MHRLWLPRHQNRRSGEGFSRIDGLLWRLRASRGSVGALRDLAVQPNKDDLFATTRMWPCSRPPAKASQSGAEISRRYDELCRLRRRVEIAESLARDAKRRLSGSERRRFSLRPSHHPDEGTLAKDGAEIAMPDRA